MCIPPQYLLALGKRWIHSYPWTHSYDSGSVTASLTSPTDLTLALRPARLPRGIAFEITARPAFVLAWGVVKTSLACTGLCRFTGRYDVIDHRWLPVFPGPTYHRILHSF
jgi:hypothetical protein